jgi:hypothetical protein
LSVYSGSGAQESNERKVLTAITRAVSWIALALFFTAVDMHFISFKLSQQSFDGSLQASQGVLDGLPHWRIYQSRVLGPYVIKWIGQLFNVSPTIAYLSFIASFLFITKLVVVKFGLLFTRGVAPTYLMLISGSLLFAVLINNPWLYPWDIAGLLISTIFVVMVLRRTNWPWFIPLIIIAFLNRESGIFICVWMVAQGWLGCEFEKMRKPNIVMMLAGCAAAIIGLAMTELLRNTLLIREIGPELWHINSNTSWFFLQIGNNFTDLVSSLTSGSLQFPFIPYFILIFGIASVIFVGIRHSATYTAVCFSFGVNFIFICLFGLIWESRILIEVIPFFSIFLSYIATERDDDRSCC